MPLASGVKAVGLSYDDSQRINRIGHARVAAWERAQIFHGRAVPQESMRHKRRTVAENRFADDMAVIVDGEASGEDGPLQLAEISYLVIAPSRRIDDAAGHERITGDFARRIDLEGRTGRTTGKRAQVGDGTARRPLHRKEICGSVPLHVGVTDNGPGVVNSDCAADCATGKRGQFFHPFTAAPVERTLSGNQTGARVSVRGLGIRTANDVAEIVDPEPTALTVAVEYAEIGDGIGLR